MELPYWFQLGCIYRSRDESRCFRIFEVSCPLDFFTLMPTLLRRFS